MLGVAAAVFRVSGVAMMFKAAAPRGGRSFTKAFAPSNCYVMELELSVRCHFLHVIVTFCSWGGVWIFLRSGKGKPT